MKATLNDNSESKIIPVPCESTRSFWAAEFSKGMDKNKGICLQLETSSVNFKEYFPECENEFAA